MSALHPDIEKVLFSETEIRQRVIDLGRVITRDFRGKDLLLVAVLRGSFIFLADLVRAIQLPCALDFMAVSSYAGSESTGIARVTLDLKKSPVGKHVLLVEDVVDTGLTLARLRGALKGRGVRSMKACAFLDKPSGRRRVARIDYRGFTVPDGFVVGYGLDYHERYRNLPYLGLLKRRVYENPGKADL